MGRPQSTTCSQTPLLSMRTSTLVTVCAHPMRVNSQNPGDPDILIAPYTGGPGQDLPLAQLVPICETRQWGWSWEFPSTLSTSVL